MNTNRQNVKRVGAAITSAASALRDAFRPDYKIAAHNTRQISSEMMQELVRIGIRNLGKGATEEKITSAIRNSSNVYVATGHDGTIIGFACTEYYNTASALHTYLGIAAAEETEQRSRTYLSRSIYRDLTHARIYDAILMGCKKVSAKTYISAKTRNPEVEDEIKGVMDELQAYVFAVKYKLIRGLSAEGNVLGQMADSAHRSNLGTTPCLGLDQEGRDAYGLYVYIERTLQGGMPTG